MLDLGSTLTIASPGALTAAGFARSDARIKLTDTVIGGATGEPLRVREARCSVRLGGPSAAVQPLEVAVAELPIFGALGLGDTAMILGLDALATSRDVARGSRVVLDVAGGGAVRRAPGGLGLLDA